MGRHVLTTYLAGPMQGKRWSGRGWRKKIAKELEAAFGDKLRIIDPVEEEPKKTGRPVSEAKKLHTELCVATVLGDEEAGKEFDKEYAPVVITDFRRVAQCDFLIMRLPHDVQTFGTHREYAKACDKHRIPIFFIHVGPVEKFPHWALWEIRRLGGKGFLEKKKYDFKEFVEYLKAKWPLLLRKKKQRQVRRKKREEKKRRQNDERARANNPRKRPQRKKKKKTQRQKARN